MGPPGGRGTNKDYFTRPLYFGAKIPIWSGKNTYFTFLRFFVGNCNSLIYASRQQRERIEGPVKNLTLPRNWSWLNSVVINFCLTVLALVTNRLNCSFDMVFVFALTFGHHFFLVKFWWQFVFLQVQKFASNSPFYFLVALRWNLNSELDQKYVV